MERKPWCYFRQAAVSSWPSLLCTALICVIVLSFFAIGAILRQRDSLVEQATKVEEILLRQREEDEKKASNLAAAVDAVDERLRVQLAAHDAHIEGLLLDTLRLAEEVFGRPAGVEEAPVTARPVPNQ